MALQGKGRGGSLVFEDEEFGCGAGEEEQPVTCWTCETRLSTTQQDALLDFISEVVDGGAEGDG